MESLNSKNLNNPYIEKGRAAYSDEDAALQFASACLKAEEAALRLIARAEQCTAGLRRKLERRRHEAVCVDAVIFHLLELQLIDDNRYARLWLQSRLRYARTPYRLLAALCAKGVARDDAEAALKAALDEETESALLLRYVKKLSRKAKRKGEKDASTLKFLLKSEGFSQWVIKRCLDLE